MKEVILWTQGKMLQDDRWNSVKGIKLFNCLFSLFGNGVSFIDRTRTVTNPVNCSVLPFLEMPEVAPTLEFAAICDKRAKHILEHAGKTNRQIAVMYSGGIDSTLVLSSLLKNASKEELKNITVLLSENSIKENKTFFNRFVVRNFTLQPSFNFPWYVGNDKFVLISGENGDQLFGSAMSDKFAKQEGFTSLYEKINDGGLIDFIKRCLPIYEKHLAESLYTILAYITAKAKVKINTVYEFWWWINFATKWQNVYTRILPYSVNIKTVKLEDNYTTFFCTDEFQQWSMNNYSSFEFTNGTQKQAAKQYIIDLTNDHEFMNKPKLGSLCNLFLRKASGSMVDTDLNIISGFPDTEFINVDNSFNDCR